MGIGENFGESLKLIIGETFVEVDDDHAKKCVEKMRKK